jgi:hypothetical protein
MTEEEAIAEITDRINQGWKFILCRYGRYAILPTRRLEFIWVPLNPRSLVGPGVPVVVRRPITAYREVSAEEAYANLLDHGFNPSLSDCRSQFWYECAID